MVGTEDNRCNAMCKTHVMMYMQVLCAKIHKEQNNNYFTNI